MIITQNTNIGRYKLLYDKNKKKMYVVDVQYAYSIFNFPKSMEQIDYNAYLIDENISRTFEIGGDYKNIGSVKAVLLTQPLVGVLYKLGTEAFRSFPSEYYVLIKILLLILTLILTSSAYFFFSKSQEKKLKEKLLPNAKLLSLKLIRPNDIKVKKIHYFRERIIAIFLLFVIPTLIYFNLNNGSENVILVIISMLFFLLCVASTVSGFSSIFLIDYDFVVEDRKES